MPGKMASGSTARSASTARAESAGDGRRVRWAEHRAQRRTAFVRAGAAAVDQYGPDASAEQIAEVAGVSRTVLYRYFRDREDLRQAIADHVVTAVIDSVLPMLRLDVDTTPREVISGAVGVIVGWFDEHPNLYHFLRGRRTGNSLEAVEKTLADEIAALLKALMTFFGIDADQSEPGAYGIVGLVEASCTWWVSRRTMSRDRITQVICAAVWQLLDGTARANNVVIDYDEALPFAALTRVQGT